MDDGKIGKTITTILLHQYRGHHIFRVIGLAEILESCVQIRVRLEYTKDPETVHCKSIEEEIRLWFDGEYLFVWSCRNNQDGKEHDEALIIARNKTSESNLEEPSMIM